MIEMKITFEWDDTDDREAVYSCVKELEEFLRKGKIETYSVGHIIVCDKV